MPSRHVALIVEDEPVMAAELADLVDSFGHDPRHAPTGADAIEILNDGGICYVLLDLQIPAHGKSLRPRVEVGRSLLHEMRRRYPGRTERVPDIHFLPVLVVSGKAKDHEDVVQALQEGADDFVRKPLRLDDRGLSQKILQSLGRSGRTDHVACAAATELATKCPVNGIDQVFACAPDYSTVTCKGVTYEFKGDYQRAVIRVLHEAAMAEGESSWQRGKIVLARAGSTELRLRNLFRRHPSWGTLIESDGRGRFRLRTA